MKTLVAITLSLVATTFAYAIENAEYRRGNHRFFIEPDLSVDFMPTLEGEYGTLETQGQQYGLNIGYEFLKPNDIYAEFAVFRALGNVQTTWTTPEGEQFEREWTSFRDKISGHLGYTFEIGDASLSPFSGFGWYKWKELDVLKMAYIPIGFKVQYPLSNRIYAGLKCTRLQYVHLWVNSPEGKISENILNENVSGYEISVPFSFTDTQHLYGWYASVEPYFLKVDEALSIAGARFAASRSF